MADNKNHKNHCRYRGVQLHANSERGCAAVRSLAGQRFLSHEVPTLPLPDCDAADCRCTYELFEDRRTAVRRAANEAWSLARQLRLLDRRGSASAGRRSND